MPKFETYKTKREIRLNKEYAIPIFVNITHAFICLGSIFSFFITSFIVGLKHVFGIKRKVYGHDFFHRGYKEIKVREVK